MKTSIRKFVDATVYILRLLLDKYYIREQERINNETDEIFKNIKMIKMEKDKIEKAKLILHAMNGEPEYNQETVRSLMDEIENKENLIASGENIQNKLYGKIE